MRTWVGLAAAVAVVVVGVAVAILSHDPLIELEAPDRGEVVADWLPDGTPVFVTRRSDEVAVLDARVPHWLDQDLEVYVSFCERLHEAWEPYTGSTYDRTGDWTGGPPAPGGLASYEAELTDDTVWVGPRRAPAARAEGADGGRIFASPCVAEWIRDDAVRQPPAGVHHYIDALEDATTPETLAASQEGSPAVVLGAVERRESDTLRACAWELSHVIEGPLCDENAPEVEEAPFSFLSSDFGGMYGSYGLYLMTSEDGRLRVEGVLPEQLEYADDARAGPEPPPDDE